MNGTQGTTERADFMRRLPKHDVDTHEDDYRGFHVVLAWMPRVGEGSRLIAAVQHVNTGLIKSINSGRRLGFASQRVAAAAAADYIDANRDHYESLAAEEEVPV